MIMASIDMVITVKHDPEMKKIAEKVSEEITDYIYNEAVNLAKTKMEDPSGDLASGIEKGDVSKTSNKITSIVSSTKLHSSHVEWGTGLYGEKEPPHYIYPTTKKVLVFEKNGEKIFAAKTRGQYPKPFMRGSIYKLRSNLKGLLKRWIKE